MIDEDKKVRRLPVRGDTRPPLPPLRTLEDDEQHRIQTQQRMRDRWEQQQRITLARDLLVAGRAKTVEAAFRLADEFCDVCAQRMPSEPGDLFGPPP